MNIAVNSDRWFSLENIEGEIWEDIPQLKNLYAISNFGRLKSYARSLVRADGRRYKTSERIVRLSVNHTGYYSYRPSIEGELRSVLIHRLIAEAFIPNPDNLPYVNHRDENKLNNGIENLEWCTAKYNSNYGTCQKRRANTLRNNLRPKLPVIKQYSLNGELINTYVGRREIEDNGFNYRSVRNCCCHNVYTANGYVWRENNDPFNAPVYRSSTSKPKKVNCYDMNMNYIKTYSSMTEAGLVVGGKKTSVNSILACCVGRYKSAYGYKWRYA